MPVELDTSGMLREQGRCVHGVRIRPRAEVSGERESCYRCLDRCQQIGHVHQQWRDVCRWWEGEGDGVADGLVDFFEYVLPTCAEHVGRVLRLVFDALSEAIVPRCLSCGDVLRDTARCGIHGTG